MGGEEEKKQQIKGCMQGRLLGYSTWYEEDEDERADHHGWIESDQTRPLPEFVSAFSKNTHQTQNRKKFNFFLSISKKHSVWHSVKIFFAKCRKNHSAATNRILIVNAAGPIAKCHQGLFGQWCYQLDWSRQQHQALDFLCLASGSFAWQTTA